MTTPTKAAPKSVGKAPADHKQSAKDQHERRLEREAILAGMPDLVPPHALRMRDRARINAIMLDATAKGAFGDEDDVDEDGEPKALDLDPRNPEDLERIKALDSLCADIDEFAESIASDSAAYATWSGGKQHETFIAILSFYNEAVGESNGS